MKLKNSENSQIKLLKILVRHGMAGVKWSEVKNTGLISDNFGKHKFDLAIIHKAKCSDLINIRNHTMKITKSGKAKLKRHLCDHDPFGTQHRQMRQSNIILNNQTVQITENCAESPLARLYVRKQKNGTRFITDQEYEAGCRLRRDFEKAGLQPSLSARWHEPVSTGTKSQSTNHVADLSATAIDAHKRVQNAMEAIGPELAGTTLDICCFLKGLEIVERERDWPCRSAKLMLKTALSILARHYGFTGSPKYSSQKCIGKIDQWGTSDYRPNL